MTDNKIKLRVFDIQRFSLHDGPGIRTTVFLKGCPLHCPWCANPESQSAEPVLLHLQNKCTACGLCAVACPQKAITMTPVGPLIRRELCNSCRVCADTCLHGAMQLSGYEADINEIIDVVIRDMDYYEADGGLTVSGGEPLMQPKGLATLLAAAKAEGLHTALETTGNAPMQVFFEILPFVDLFLFDIKHSDKEKLYIVTGGNIDTILSNLSLAAANKPTVVRVPVIPNFNHSMEEIKAIFKTAESHGVKTISLLPYHVLGKSKYSQLGIPYLCSAEKGIEKQELLPYIELGKAMGINVTLN